MMLTTLMEKNIPNIPQSSSLRAPVGVTKSFPKRMHPLCISLDLYLRMLQMRRGQRIN